MITVKTSIYQLVNTDKLIIPVWNKIKKCHEYKIKDSKKVFQFPTEARQELIKLQ